MYKNHTHEVQTELTYVRVDRFLEYLQGTRDFLIGRLSDAVLVPSILLEQIVQSAKLQSCNAFRHIPGSCTCGVTAIEEMYL